MIAASLLLFLTATAPDTRPEEVLTVGEVRRIVDEGRQNGQLVRVRGYLSAICRHNSCQLNEKRKDRRNGPSISLAGETAVERRLVAAAGTQIVLMATIGEPAFQNLGNGDFVMCADRCPELIPVAIEK